MRFVYTISFAVECGDDALHDSEYDNWKDLVVAEETFCHEAIVPLIKDKFAAKDVDVRLEMAPSKGAFNDD